MAFANVVPPPAAPPQPAFPAAIRAEAAGAMDMEAIRRFGANEIAHVRAAQGPGQWIRWQEIPGGAAGNLGGFNEIGGNGDEARGDVGPEPARADEREPEDNPF